MFLTGRIDITDNLPFVVQAVQNQDPSVVVINLDEDSQQLKKCHNVLGGTELLPGVNALMAEIDGDEQTYDYLYSMQFQDPFVVQYVSAIIAALHIGKNILMYYPTLDPAETKTVPKLIDQFWNNFGIGIGLLGYNIGVYDNTKINIWAKMLYTARVIGPMEFLASYPGECSLDGPIMELLLADIRPVADDFDKGIAYILSLWKHIKAKPDLKIPFHSV